MTTGSVINPNPPLVDVQITINNLPFTVRAGRNSVAGLKQLAGVHACDELSVIKDGKPVALPNDGFVKIEGGEAFLSSPASCGSS